MYLKIKKMRFKTKVIISILTAFLLVSIGSNLFIRIWTKSFDRITEFHSIQDSVDFFLVNGRYIYVWSNDKKILIPPSQNAKSESMSNFIQSDDLIIKNRNSSEIYLKRNNRSMSFKILDGN